MVDASHGSGRVCGYQVAQGNRKYVELALFPSSEPQTLRRKLKFPEVHPAYVTARRTWLWPSRFLSCIFSCSLTCREHKYQMLHLPTHSTHTYTCAHACACTYTRRDGSFSPRYLLWIKQYIPNTARDDQAIKRTKLMVCMSLFLYENRKW